MSGSFKGFSEESLRFLAMLRENNEKAWFDAHRDEYDRHILAPSRLLVEDLGEAIRRFVPGIIAEPKVNRSLFRINRDTRFSNDKSPYKTHLALWFWEGHGPRMACSGFYFHLDPEIFMIGAGIYRFTPETLAGYRARVINEMHGDILTKIADDMAGKGFPLQGLHYKRIPRGFPADHARAELLKLNGLYSGAEFELSSILYSRDLIDFCVSNFRLMQPLHEWLLAMTENA